MVLATADDVAVALGRPLTEGAETDRAEALLVTASAAVVAEAGGYRFEPDTYTVSRFARRGRVKLPAKVDSVDAVYEIACDDGTLSEVTDWTSRGSTLYGLTGGCEYEIEFTVTAAVPDEVAKLTAGIVAATVGAPPVGLESETVGPFARSFVDSSGRVWLSKTDKQILAKYRVPKPAIQL